MALSFTLLRLLSDVLLEVYLMDQPLSNASRRGAGQHLLQLVEVRWIWIPFGACSFLLVRHNYLRRKDGLWRRNIKLWSSFWPGQRENETKIGRKQITNDLGIKINNDLQIKSYFVSFYTFYVLQKDFHVDLFLLYQNTYSTLLFF